MASVNLSAYLALIDRSHAMIDAEPWWDGRFAELTQDAARLWAKLGLAERQAAERRMQERYNARIDRW